MTIRNYRFLLILVAGVGSASVVTLSIAGADPLPQPRSRVLRRRPASEEAPPAAAGTTLGGMPVVTSFSPPPAAPAPPAVPNAAAPPAPSPALVQRAPLPPTLDSHYEWNGRYKHFIGYDAVGSTGIIASNVITYGEWRDTLGLEYFFGFNKAGNTYQSSTTRAQTGNSLTETVTQSGTKNPYALTLGAGARARLFQARWLMIYWGGFGGLTYQTDTETPTGTTTTSTPDVTNPSTFSYSATNMGKTKSSVGTILFAGAKLGSEVYLRWFPNLALGFATGLMLSSGGATKTTSDSTNTSYSVTNGTASAPTTSSNSASSSQDPGLSSRTFGVGGTTFSITGLFSLRYVW